MTGDSKTAWATNPYVSWRHPAARMIAVMLVVLLDICVHGTDPINDSRVESYMPGIGSIYNFLFRMPSNGGRLLSRLGLIFLSACGGLYIGRQWLHHWLLRDVCGLSMFGGTSGSFITMGLGVAGACLIGGAIYNLLIPSDVASVTGSTGMEARTFGKILQVSSAVAHVVAAVQVADGVMQDRQRYPSWGSHLKRHWRRSLGGWVRVLCTWAVVAALLGCFLCSIFGAADTWGDLNEIARVFFASALLFFDLFVVVQDWEFPTFQPPPNLDQPVLMAGSFEPFFFCGAGSRLLAFVRGRELGDTEKLFNVTISAPWLAYGPLLFVACLDFSALLTQLLYSPADYGQYVDPSTRRIWTITDNSYLHTAYQSGVIQRPELVTWAARHPALSLGVNATSDVLSSASFSGTAMSWKILAATPGFLMLATFVPLLIFADCLGRNPHNRPALLEALPESEKLCTKVAPEPSPSPPPQLPTKPPPPNGLPPEGGDRCMENLMYTAYDGGCKTTEKSLPAPALPLEPTTPPGLGTPPGFRVKDDIERGFQVPLRDEGEAQLSTIPEVDLQVVEQGATGAPKRLFVEDGSNMAVGSTAASSAEAYVDAADPNSFQAKLPLAIRSVVEDLEDPLRTAADAAQLRDAVLQQSSTEPLREARSRPSSASSRATTATDMGNMSSTTAGSRATTMEVGLMSSSELHSKARARHRKRLDAVGHFDVLLQKDSRSLGLIFKLPEATCSKSHTTAVQQALLKGLQLTAAPDGSELLQFGRHKDLTMCDVADNFPSFCMEALQEETDSSDPSPELMRFTMYLRMTRPEFKDEESEKHEDVTAHDGRAARTLLITDIEERGIIDEYNRAQAAAGQWDRVVIPGMRISSVNGIRRDPLAMANALCKATVLTVRVHFPHSEQVSDHHTHREPVNDKAQRLLEERISKIVCMEGPQIVDSVRTQAEWEAMASNLAAALVKEVYKGDHLLQPQPPSLATLPPGVPLPPDFPAPPMVNGATRSDVPALPPGFPPLTFPPPSVPSHTDLDKTVSLDEAHEWSEEEWV